MSDGDTLALTAEEREALIGLLRRAIDEARYPYSRRYNPIKAILAKLSPPKPQPDPLPPLKPGIGLVVTSVPKVTLRKACVFNILRVSTYRNRLRTRETLLFTLRRVF